MAADTDRITEQAKAGWRGFVVFLAASTGAVALSLILMGVFLL